MKSQLILFLISLQCFGFGSAERRLLDRVNGRNSNQNGMSESVVNLLEKIKHSDDPQVIEVLAEELSSSFDMKAVKELSEMMTVEADLNIVSRASQALVAIDDFEVTQAMAKKIIATPDLEKVRKFAKVIYGRDPNENITEEMKERVLEKLSSDGALAGKVLIEAQVFNEPATDELMDRLRRSGLVKKSFDESFMAFGSGFRGDLGMVAEEQIIKLELTQNFEAGITDFLVNFRDSDFEFISTNCNEQNQKLDLCEIIFKLTPSEKKRITDKIQLSFISAGKSYSFETLIKTEILR